MPSKVMRRSRRHGRMMNHQMATGNSTGEPICHIIKATFIKVGGSVGPGSTRVKYGPVIHRIHT